MNLRNLIRAAVFVFGTVLSIGVPAAHAMSQPCATLTCPSNMVFSSATPRVVTYPEPTLRNTCGISLVVTCSPPAGAVFPIGTTIVTCQARSGAPTNAECRFSVTVGGIPTISAPPKSTTNINGSSANFSVTATGAPPITYQWRFSGSNLMGETGSELVLDAVRREHAGNYSVVVGNSFGATTSADAHLSVITPAFVGPLIRPESVWRYRFNGSNAPAGWRNPGFNASLWPTGAGELGFGDGDETTVIGNRTNGITAYFRHAFNVDIPQSISNLTLHLRRDDGAIAYLNGTEVFRSNMPTGLINAATLASDLASDDGNTVFSTVVNPDLLRPGTNVLAVEVHQGASNNVDMSFDADLSSCPVDPSIPCGPPVILAQSPSITTTNGSLVAFTVSVPNTPPMGYRWRLNGTNLVASADVLGVDSSRLILRAARQEHQGTYRLHVTNAYGETISAPMQLTVITPAFLGSLVQTGAVWRYLFNGTAPPTAWDEPGFNDGPWLTGPAPLGFGDNPATVIGVASDRYITAYFRKSFTVGTPQSVSNLVLNLRRDDGAIVYLNGHEVHRSNLPAGVVDHLTLSLTNAFDDGSATFAANVPPNLLRPGTNTVAVEVHQWSDSSSDMTFDLSMASCLEGDFRLAIAPFVNRQVVVTWSTAGYRLQGATELPVTGSSVQWTNLATASPAYFLISNPYRYFRLTCP